MLWKILKIPRLSFLRPSASRPLYYYSLRHFRPASGVPAANFQIRPLRRRRCGDFSGSGPFLSPRWRGNFLWKLCLESPAHVYTPAGRANPPGGLSRSGTPAVMGAGLQRPIHTASQTGFASALCHRTELLTFPLAPGLNLGAKRSG